MSASMPRRLVAVMSAAILLITLAAPVAADEPQTPVGSIIFDAASATYDPQSDSITVTGTATCAAPGILSVFAEASQQIGQHTVLGGGFADVICTEALGDLPVSLTVFGGGGFNPGTVDLWITVFSCTSVACSDFGSALTVDARPTSNAPDRAPVEPAPANDDASSPTPIGYGSVSQSTVSATGAETDPTCAGVPFIDHTVWFSFTAPTSGYLALSTAGSSYDTVVVVLDESGASVGCNDDVLGGEILISEVTVPVTAGATYLIVVGSWESSPGGHLELTLGEGVAPPPPVTPPANDEPGGAHLLAVGGAAAQTEAEIAAATESAADPLDAPCEFPVGFSTDTVWYSVTAAADGYLEANTFGSTYDTVLYVFAGDTLLACNDQTGGNQSQVIWEVTAGVTYHLMVGAWHGTPPGDLAISVATSPPPLVVDVAVAGGATVQGGAVIVSGTVTCSEEADAELFVSVFQEGGRFAAEGSDGVSVPCGSSPTAWTVTLTGTSRFQNGSAFAFVETFAATTDGRSGTAFIEAELTLSPAGANRR